MTSQPSFHHTMHRRLVLQALAVGWVVPRRGLAADDAHAQARAALREGAVVVVMRHALAPGVGDPPGFDLARCATQRNLSDEGQEQARRIGAWFRSEKLQPAAVRASQWCRCLDTARLAFGRVEPWPALNSLFNRPERALPQQAELQAALAKVARGSFEVWVTHQVNISSWVGDYMGSGEAVVVRAGDAKPLAVAPLKIG